MALRTDQAELLFEAQVTARNMCTVMAMEDNEALATAVASLRNCLLEEAEAQGIQAEMHPELPFFVVASGVPTTPDEAGDFTGYATSCSELQSSYMNAASGVMFLQATEATS